MEFSYLFGLLINCNFSWLQWLFFFFCLLFLLIGISASICLLKKETKQKMFWILGYFLLSLFTFGIIGSITVVLIHFVTYSLVSEFRKDY